METIAMVQGFVAVPEEQNRNGGAAPRLTFPDARAPRICIFARKDLTHNTRVTRQAKVLADADVDVTVIGIKPPSPDQMALAPTVRFLSVQPRPRLMAALRSDTAKRLLGARGRQQERFCRSAWEKKALALREMGHEPPPEPARLSLRHLLARAVVHPVLLAAMWVTRLKPADVTPSLAWIRANGTHETLVQMFGAAMPVMVTHDFCARAAALVADEDFDLVQAHDSMALQAARRAGRNKRTRILYDAVEIPDDRSGWSLQRTPQWLLRLEAALDSRIIQRADAVITVSNGLADWMVGRYKIPKPSLVRNCRLYEEIEVDDTIRRDCGLSGDERLALYLNSLYPGQGLEQLVDAIAHLAPHVHVATLGPITKAGYVDGLLERARALGVDGRFHILPTKSPEEMLQYAAGADLGVVPRQNTSFNNYISLPNRVFELTMARLPIAAPSLPDMAGLVTQFGIGTSFDETDPRDIARVIAEMLEPAALARYRSAATAAARELSWENEGTHYLRIVAQTLGLSYEHRGA